MGAESAETPTRSRGGVIDNYQYIKEPFAVMVVETLNKRCFMLLMHYDDILPQRGLFYSVVGAVCLWIAIFRKNENRRWRESSYHCTKGVNRHCLQL